MATTWTYRNDLLRDEASLVGFDVEAKDGGIGKVVEESLEVDASHLVVDTGFWIFGTKRLIPAGVVTSVDYDAETIHVEMTKDQVKSSPEYRTDEDLNPLDESNRPVDRSDSAHRRPFVDYYASWPFV